MNLRNLMNDGGVMHRIDLSIAEREVTRAAEAFNRTVEACAEYPLDRDKLYEALTEHDAYVNAAEKLSDHEHTFASVGGAAAEYIQQLKKWRVEFLSRHEEKSE